MSLFDLMDLDPSVKDMYKTACDALCGRCDPNKSNITYYTVGDRQIISDIQKTLLGAPVLNVGDTCDVLISLNNPEESIVARTPSGFNILLTKGDYHDSASTTMEPGNIVISNIVKVSNSGTPYIDIGDEMIISRILPEGAILAKHPDHPFDIYLEKDEYSPSAKASASMIVNDPEFRAKIVGIYDAIFIDPSAKYITALPNNEVTTVIDDRTFNVKVNPLSKTITIKCM